MMPPMTTDQDSAPCPCGSALPYARCCGALHARFAQDGTLAAANAEALMRSRYSAFVLSLTPYLLASWHPSTRPAELDLSREERFVKWLALDVLSTQAGSASDDAGVVEFVARYKVNGRAQRLHEVSRFRKEDGRWFYVDGDAEEG